MQVAQLPDSQENGGDMPSWRAVCRIVVPGRCSVVSVRPSSSIVTIVGRVVLGVGRPTSSGSSTGSAGGEALDVDPPGVDAVGERGRPRRRP